MIIGSCAGSFCHAMALRFSFPPRYKKKHRSVCDACGRTLAPYEVIPIVSYLSLKGHCRTCHHKLSSSLLLVEFGTALLYLGVFLCPTLLPYKLLILFILHLLLIATISDIYFMIIPNRLLIIFFFLSILLIPWLPPLSISERLIGLMLGLVLPVLILALTKGGLGAGDVKLFMLLGWLLGGRSLLHLMIFACATGLLGFLFLSLFRKTERPSLLPFAPFIFAGYLLEECWQLMLSTEFPFFR